MDIGEKVFFSLVGLVVFGGLALLLGCAWDEIKFHSQEQFECKATLIQNDYRPSTLRTHTTPIFSSKGGMHMAVHTSGRSEKYITMWHCEGYGNLVSMKEKVFRLAQPSSILYLKKYNDDVRIVGIKE